jgi:predicted Rossmann fold flavoprotein
METKIENENRVFPKSNKAQSVFDVLYGAMQENRVKIMTDSPVKEILVEDGKITGVRTSSGIILGKKVIIATGGTSHPETGSTGDAYKWLEKLGHKIIIPEPSLVPLTTKDIWTHKLAGMSLSNVKITTYVDQVKQKVKATKNSKPENSKVLFTHVGLSGPTILNMSKEIRELLKYGDVSITIDILPKYDYSKLNTELQNIFETNNNKKIKNSLDSILPSRLTLTVLEMSNINPEKKCNEISREERVSLMKIIKAVPINIKGLQSLDKAIISSGGVDLEEVDFRTMQSKIHSNLFLIGDILNIDRPSGGFSLQICWTTGMVAAINI